MRHRVRRLELERDLEMLVRAVEIAVRDVQGRKIRVPQRILRMPLDCFEQRDGRSLAQTAREQERSKIVQDAKVLGIIAKKLDERGLRLLAPSQQA